MFKNTCELRDAISICGALRYVFPRISSGLMARVLPFSKDILYELASASDLPLPISRDKESTDSSEFPENSDRTPYRVHRSSAAIRRQTVPTLGRMPLHGPVDRISDWYNTNLYNCAATASKTDNDMKAI